MVAIGILYSTTEPKVVRNYVIALWLADIGHIATTGYVMGIDRFLNFSNYNPTTWGNVGITVSERNSNVWILLLTIQGFPVRHSDGIPLGSLRT